MISVALPSTAAELNDWMRSNFAVFEGPSRAFFELPVDFLGGAMWTEATHVTRVKRVTYVTVGLAGEEGLASRAVAAGLMGAACLMGAGNDDASEPLFIRSWFVYADGRVTGRLAFWRDECNRALKELDICREEGRPYASI